MSMSEDQIIERIQQLHPDSTIDVAGEDCNFEVYIISNEFSGKNTLQRQQPILRLFAEELASGKLHALGIKAKTPSELAENAGLIQIKLQ